MERIKVAYWLNAFGEECASRVHAEYSHGEQDYVVVHDWREGTRGHGFVVMKSTACFAVRMETPR